MDARVVVLPLPVGPVTKTIPLEKLQKRLITGGSFNESKVGKVDGIVLKTADTPST